MKILSDEILQFVIVFNDMFEHAACLFVLSYIHVQSSILLNLIAIRLHKYVINKTPFSLNFAVGAVEPNGHAGSERLTRSVPGTPTDSKPPSFEVTGSAENLFGRLWVDPPYIDCDPDPIPYTSRETRDALDVNQEDMNRAAHYILQQENCLHSGCKDALQ